MFLEMILQQLAQMLSLVPVTNKEKVWINETMMMMMTTTTMMMMMMMIRGRIQKRTWSSMIWMNWQSRETVS